MFIKLRPTALGAITQLYAGTTPDAKELNGKVSVLALFFVIAGFNLLSVSHSMGTNWQCPRRRYGREAEREAVFLARGANCSGIANSSCAMIKLSSSPFVSQSVICLAILLHIYSFLPLFSHVR